LSSTFVSFGPSTPGDPYGILLKMTLAELQSEMSQALIQSHGLFTATQLIRKGECDVLINAHQVRYAAARD
jgi:hypothetical protein